VPDERSDGAGWVLFIGIMLMLVGVLNIVYGIAAIGNSHFFAKGAEYIISDLNTWGWILLILGVLQVIAAFSVWAGQEFGRWFAIVSASLVAVASLLTLPGYPFFSLAIFSVSLLIIYGMATYGGVE
jgi:uncharacterized membrane protein (DUF2068 family)